jgi:hypothetical protein
MYAAVLLAFMQQFSVRNVPSFASTLQFRRIIFQTGFVANPASYRIGKNAGA